MDSSITDKLQNLKSHVQAKVGDPNYVPTGKWDNVRPMNLKISGSLFCVEKINSFTLTSASLAAKKSALPV